MFKFFRKKSKADQDSKKTSAPEPEKESISADIEVQSQEPNPAEELEQPSPAPLEADTTSQPAAVVDEPESQNQEIAEKPSTGKLSIFQRLKQSLSKTRHSLADSVASLLLGKKTIDEDLLEELETILIMADVGVDATQMVMDNITDNISRKKLKDPQAVYDALQKQLLAILQPCEQPLNLTPQQQPFMMLIIGVNGAGKTTTIGKMANQFKQHNQTVMLAAGDTFRAAAVEQLQAWGERNEIPVIAQHTGADSASVIYDALESAKAKQTNVLIADTAGRLHTRDNLMEELKKIARVTHKLLPDAPHEVMLVLDATTGQNALQQARIFHSMINIDSIAITKLDGTAKGGIIFAIANELKLPIRYIGVGEGIEDLRPFKADDFVKALFSQNSAQTQSKLETT